MQLWHFKFFLLILIDKSSKNVVKALLFMATLFYILTNNVHINNLNYQNISSGGGAKVTLQR